jgi:hypothetical protein
MCMIMSLTLQLLMIFDLNFAIPMSVLLKLSHLIITLIIDSTKLFLRNFMSLLMIASLGLSSS